MALEEQAKQVGFLVIKARPNLEYKASDLRDPFQEYPIEEEKKIEAIPQVEAPKQEEVVTPPALTIQGIIWGGRFPQAIINNKVVKIGDIIEEAQVSGISKEGVVITFKNRQFNLSSPAAVNLESVKRKSEGGQNEGR